MKKQNFLISAHVLISSLILMASPLNAQISDAEKLYEEAVYQLEATGNFEEAIVIFDRIVKEFPENKPVASNALMKKGICYERLGSQKATEAYEQIINQYPDQLSNVTLARDRLAALHKGEPTALTLTRLLSPDDYLECQTLSPDGTKLASIGWNGGQNVAVSDIATGKMKYITTYDWGQKSCEAYLLAWSPDSKEIVHRASCWGIPDEESSQLRITTLDGESRLLYTNKSGAGIVPCTWLPNKKEVLAVMGDNEGVFKLVLISVNDGAMHEVCPLQMTFGVIGSPDLSEASGIADISPDGRFIVFDDGPLDDKHDLFIISVDGGEKMALTDHPADEIEPRWSPDGKHIVFRSDRHGSWALWGVAIRDGQVNETPFMILEGMQDQDLADWTPKGLCTRVMTYPSDVYTFEIDPVNHVALGKPLILESSNYGGSSYPRWSPDGKYLAYRSFPRSEWSGYLMFVPSKGGETKKIKYTYPVVPKGGSLQWMPNGSIMGHVLYGVEKELYFSLLDPEVGEWEARQIPTGDFTDGISLYTWRSDGKALFYTLNGKDDGIGIISHDLETGRESYIISATIADDSLVNGWWGLRASPDNNQVAFNWNNKIGIVDINTGSFKQIDCVGDQQLLAPSWAPDGKYLLAKGPPQKGEEINELFIVSLADNTYKSLNISQYLPKGARIMGSHDWSPDGKTIAFDTRTWKSEANLIQNVIPGK